MKKWMIAVLLIIGSGLAAVWLFLPDREEDETVTVVEDRYRGDNGLIANYPDGEGNTEYLSESIGLYLDYLLVIEDGDAFAAEVERLSEFTEELENGTLLKWKVEEDISVNALIDDVRIAYALQRGAELFGEESYQELSESIQQAVYHYQYDEGEWHDFYDWPSGSLSQEVHFSYFSAAAWESFGWDGASLEGVTRAALDDSLYYYERYNVAEQEKEFYTEGEVNLIDQVLIMQQMEAVTGEVQPLENWLYDTYETNGRLTGRYDRTTMEESVAYEAPAVYALIMLHFLDKGDMEKAADWKEPLENVHEPEQVSTEAHFFDYILAETALERLEKETQAAEE
ncbi:hypothetical protein ATL39_2810 [Sinobaca qinghaiensis]|uniref:Glycosyl hydrolase family 8 n=1 Tax=Sinobaca qinghaiensis TaxID=342944 RepID=A0A419V0F9_9BACL|nr:hypothetical protein [Sinobaca qinghaiensis]RKD71413.1 hypothetical protein ATL39_2810 [Sinobaca qinghaiensis]